MSRLGGGGSRKLKVKKVSAYYFFIEEYIFKKIVAVVIENGGVKVEVFTVVSLVGAGGGDKGIGAGWLAGLGLPSGR